MKANAPEKIYLFENPITETPDGRWLSKRSDDTDIEYTRTDAFIEKAKKWFEQQPEQYDANGVRCYSTENLEDFVNYMRGD